MGNAIYSRTADERAKIVKNAALNAIYRLKRHRDLISPARGLYVIALQNIKLMALSQHKSCYL